MGIFHSKCPIKDNADGAVPTATAPLKRILYVFDFDNTILDDDSEGAILSAYEKVKGEPAPASVIDAFNRFGSIEYAQYILDYVTFRGVGLVDILRVLLDMSFVPGMKRLLEKIQSTTKSAPHSHLIILSGSFDYFIRSYLSACVPPIKPSAILSNLAVRTNRVIPDTLLFKPYGLQSTCSLCSSCLCKGAALNKYMSDHGPFDQVIFVCDGSNDVCPAIKLRRGDVLFIRKGYALEYLIKQALAEGKTEAGGSPSTSTNATTATTVTATTSQSKSKELHHHDNSVAAAEPPKLLFVFDFDFTIVAKNSEQIYRSVVAKKKGVPEKQLDPPPYPIKWDHMCQELVNYVFGDECGGVTLEDVLDEVKRLPMVPGMELLLGHLTTLVLSTNHNASLIVLSGANDLFISTKLASLHPPITPTKIISNHATMLQQGGFGTPTSGSGVAIAIATAEAKHQASSSQVQQSSRLIKFTHKLLGLNNNKDNKTPSPIPKPRHGLRPPNDEVASATAASALGFIYTPHSNQHSCSMCNHALCKGAELEAYVEDHGGGSSFDAVHFFCDGTNDVCPAMRLREQDYVYIRSGYGFEELLLGTGKAPGGRGIPISIRAKIIRWVNGIDLWDKLMENLDLSYIEDD